MDADGKRRKGWGGEPGESRGQKMKLKVRDMGCGRRKSIARKRNGKEEERKAEPRLAAGRRRLRRQTGRQRDTQRKQERAG